MEIDNINKKDLIEYLIENSIFTKRQITIIYNRKKGERRERVSRGAYYRVLEQGRSNIRRTLYSLILLEILGFLDDDKKNALDRLIRQLDEITSSDINVSDVIYILDEIIKRLSKV